MASRLVRVSRSLLNSASHLKSTPTRVFSSLASTSASDAVINNASTAVPASRATISAPSPLATLYSIPSFTTEMAAIHSIYRSNSRNERAFFINDVGVVERQVKRWHRNLPRVRPFYAVKCNPDETLLKVLVSMGTGFDCASGEEMAACLKLGVAPKDIIFANPIKNVKDLKYAAKMGINKMTFDNEDELRKIAQYHPTSELVMRLLPDDSGSVMRFGTKFGAPAETIEPMLRLAKQLRLNVIGTSFHIGSGCFNANKYRDAISLARDVFNMAERVGLPRFTFLDLGGGFPGNPVENQPTGETPAFETFASVIRSSLNEFFPAADNEHVTIIGEPGRYMATAWSTLFTIVQGKRLVPAAPGDEKKKFLYYINDGVYGSFNCIMFDHATPTPIPAYRFLADAEAASKSSSNSKPLSLDALRSGLSHVQPTREYAYAFSRSLHSSRASEEQRTCISTFFGPTCDSMDVVAKEIEMEELHVGDWLAFPHMGAYSTAAASTFNGMQRPTLHYCRSKQ